MKNPSDILSDPYRYDPRPDTERLRSLYANCSWRDPKKCEQNTLQLARTLGKPRLPNSDICDAIGELIRSVMRGENIYETHLIAPSHIRSILLEELQFYETIDQRAELGSKQLAEFVTNILKHAPELAFMELEEGAEAPAVYLIEAAGNPAAFVTAIFQYFMTPEFSAGYLFPTLHKQLFANLCRASGYEPDHIDQHTNVKPLLPQDSGLSPIAMCNTYLKDTPFLDFFMTVLPFIIPEHLKVHTAVIAKTGWGKTQLLQQLILGELQKSIPPSLIVLDSTGAMVDRIQRLAVFNDRLKDRILIIDPAHSPALNMFDVSNPRFNSYSPEQKESLQSEVVGLFNYIFASKEYDLSGQMGLGFAYAVRLILSRKGYTVTDLRHLLEEAPRSWEQSRFASDIQHLDEDARDFFKHHFFADALKGTRASIARRLHALIAIPTFRRMFTASSNALDLYSETQDKASIVLVNTNQQLLSEDGYILFGRYIIARTMAAMFERAQIRDERKRRTTHLIIDESAPYFDASFDSLLTRVRQYGLKVTIAFQHLDQLDDKLRNSVAGQTSVKYIGGMSPVDERRVAAQIRCEADFIANLNKDSRNPPQWSEWAVYVDGLTKHPMRLQLPFFSLENQPSMSDKEHTALLERNRRAVSAGVQSPPEHPVIQRPPSAHAPSEARQSGQEAPESGSTW